MVVTMGRRWCRDDDEDPPNAEDADFFVGLIESDVDKNRQDNKSKKNRKKRKSLLASNAGQLDDRPIPLPAEEDERNVHRCILGDSPNNVTGRERSTDTSGSRQDTPRE